MTARAAATPLVLFDLDGTLVDSFEDIRAGVARACAEVGLAATEALLHLATRGVSLEEFYRAATEADPGAPAERGRYAGFAATYRAHYLPGCATTVPFPGVPELLAALRALPAPPVVAVATTKRTETARLVLEGTGLAALVDVVAGSDGIPPKPDPAVLVRAAQAARIDVTRAVMVGDTDRDLLAARAAGAQAIAVTWGGFTRDELAALAPDELVDRVEELLDALTRPA